LKSFSLKADARFFVSDNLEDLLASASSDSFIQNAKEKGIQEVFITVSKENADASKLKAADSELKKSRIRTSYISLDRVRENNFTYIDSILKYIHEANRNRTCLFLFNAADRKAALSLLPVLLMDTSTAGAAVQETRKRGFASPQEFASEYEAHRKGRSHRTEADFHPSRFSIRVKLLSITTGIIVAALLVSIIAATYFFQIRSEVLIQDYNLSLARIIGEKIESDLRNLTYRARLFASSTVETGEPGGVENFFERNENVLFLSLFRKEGNELVPAGRWSNTAAQKTYGVKEETYKGLEDEMKQSVKESFDGPVVIRNASRNMTIPLIAISLPVYSRNGTEVVLVHLISGGLLKAFQSGRQTDIFELFMVDTQGNLVMHTDEKIAISGSSMADLPIVKALLRSRLDNGSQKYSMNGRDFLGSYYITQGGLGIISTVPAEKAFAAVYQIQRQNILILIIVLTASFIIVFIFARSLTVPIVRLAEAIKQVERGFYDINVKPSSGDEIGLLTNAFVSMARGLDEREKIKEAFGKFVNPEIAERALKGEMKLGGSKTNCTVLFCDIRDFTGLSERIDSEQLVELLNLYFTEMVDSIQRTGGVVDKFIGDAIMAHWGALERSTTDARDAVQAALNMRSSLLDLNRLFKETGKEELRFGVGINTGDVVAGQIGSDRRLEYTIIGDAVNLASRIEYLNKHFGTDILIASETREMTGNRYRLVEMPPMQIRGKKDPQITYAVLGNEDDPQCPKTLEELRARIGIHFSARDALEHLKTSTDTLAGGNLEIK